MSRIHKTTLATAVSLSMASLGGQAQAAGFALMEKNATDLGQAYANLATGNGEASGMVGNPAAMTQIDGTGVSGGLAHVRPSFELQAGATSRSALGPTAGGLGGDAGESAVIPNASIVHQINERTRVGVALTVPFGLATEYDEEWLGRYHGIESRVEVIELNPAFSLDVTPELSIAAGLVAQYSEAKLTSATPPDLAQGTPEGTAEIEGDDWALGFNLGLLWQATDQTRVGVSYRSGVDHGLDGDIEYSATPMIDGDVRAGLDLPSSVAATVTHEFTDSVRGSLGLLWTGWSSFDELRVRQTEMGLDDIVTRENWDDTLRVSMGGEWEFAPRWTVRAGGAYDPTPVPSAEFRTARLPDADRIWGSIGLGYELNKHWSVDLGYTHIWLNDSTIDNVTSAPLSDRLQGEYEAEVDILGLQVNARF